MGEVSLLKTYENPKLVKMYENPKLVKRMKTLNLIFCLFDTCGESTQKTSRHIDSRAQGTSGLLFVSEKRARAPETERRNREIRRKCACVCIYIHLLFAFRESVFFDTSSLFVLLKRRAKYGKKERIGERDQSPRVRKKHERERERGISSTLFLRWSSR